MADVDILSLDISLACTPLWQEDNPLGVSCSAVLSYENDPTVLRVSQQVGWGVDVGLDYLEQDRLEIDHDVRIGVAELSLNASIVQSSQATPQIVEAAYPLVDGPDLAFVGDTLTQVCKTCGSVHIMSGSCPFEVTASLHGAYRGDALVRLMPESGLLLDPQASAVVLPVADPMILTVDRAAITGSAVGISDSAMLASQKWDVAALERSGVAFLGDVNPLACVNCGSFHAGLSCPSTLALAPYELRRGDVFSGWPSPDRASFSQVIMPPWREWPTAPVYLDAEFGDYLAATVRGAVLDVVASHGLVERDLIIQVAIIVQAETGMITQIGTVGSN